MQGMAATAAVAMEDEELTLKGRAATGLFCVCVGAFVLVYLEITYTW